MAKYLAGQIVPLTPSQVPTNVSHLAKYSSAPAAAADGSTLSESFTAQRPPTTSDGQSTNQGMVADTTEEQPQSPGSYCSIM